MTLSTSFHHLIFLCFYIVFFSRCCNFVAGTRREYFDAKHALVKKLTNKSDTIKEILPARDSYTPVNVKIRIKLRQIATVDEKNQAMRLTVWFTFVWNNPFLQWDPKEYQGIESVHANNEFFWVPDVALFNEASLEEEIEILYKRLATKLIITRDGNCTWNAPATLLTQCRIDVSRFPFDEQKCHVTIGSWTYSGYKINITYWERNADLDNFIPNGEWELESATLANNVRPYGPENIPYPDVTLSLKLSRRSLYYGLNIVIPCALIALIALFSFVLPSDHGERVSLVITVLLANSVYMLIVSQSLPETSDAVPVLGIYCLGMIVEIALCLVATCMTLKVREFTTPMPDWVEILVIQHIARVVCVKPDGNLPRAQSVGRISVSLNEKITKCKPVAVTEQESNTEDIALLNMKERQLKGCEENLLDEVRLITEELRSRQEEEAITKKWKKAAKVLDRFFLLIFFIIYLCLICYLLSST